MNPNSVKIRSALSATLIHLADAGKITRKSIQFASDVSYSEANRWFSGDDSPTLQQFIQIISDTDIDPDARRAIATAVGLNIDVPCAGDTAVGSIGHAMDLILKHSCDSTELAKRMNEFMRDKILSSAESAEARGWLSKLRITNDEIDTLITAHTGVIQSGSPRIAG